MSHYAATIKQAITDAGYGGYADHATVVLVEDCLRTNRTGLDHLDREELAIEASALVADLVLHPTETANLCELLAFEVPAWIAQPPTRQPMSAERTREAILATLATAFPATRFHLTQGRGAAGGHLVLDWDGGPAKGSVDDVVAQFLPPETLAQGTRYACTAIYTCRHQLAEVAGQ